MKNASFACTRRVNGFSLIELLVAMAMAMIVTLTLLATLQTFEGRKRSTTSVNDIGQSGNWAIYLLDQWVRSAGSGFSEGSGSMYGCTISAMKSGTQILPRTSALPSPFASVNPGVSNTFKLIPLMILPDQTTPSISAKTSDVLLTMAGSSGQSEAATQFSAVPTAAQLNLLSTRGFSASDLVLIADLSSAPTGTPCLIEQVGSSFTFSTSTPTALPLNTTGAYYGATINSKSLIAFTDTTNDYVANLGNIVNNNPPTFMVIGVGDNNSLQGFDLLLYRNPSSNGEQVPFTIADGVFELHALYGIDTDSDNTVDSWVKATGNYAPANLAAGTATALKLIKCIKAVRVGLIMRTSLPEKKAVSENTLTLFSDLGSAVTYTRELSDSERLFRYRVLEATIPLRNTVMVSSSTS